MLIVQQNVWFCFSSCYFAAFEKGTTCSDRADRGLGSTRPLLYPLYTGSQSIVVCVGKYPGGKSQQWVL